jgi:hypothetical protein
VAAPAAMILGVPVLEASAPTVRIGGRKISNWVVNIETLGGGIQDALFGFRVYPITPLIVEMSGTRFMRRFDFDAEAAVRLSWRGVRAVNLAAPVRYFSQLEGGISHFNYWRDNVLLTSMYLRLALGWLVRLPLLMARRLS